MTETDQTWLIRLLNSSHFDMSFAISYLLNTKEMGLLNYIEVDFYIIQIFILYFAVKEISDVLHPYLIYRCKTDVDFSIKCACLIDAYLSFCPENYDRQKRKLLKLKEFILYNNCSTRKLSNNSQSKPYNEKVYTLKNKALHQSHNRSKSDATIRLFSTAMPSSILEVHGQIQNLPTKVFTTQNSRNDNFCTKNDFEPHENLNKMGGLSSRLAFNTGCYCDSVQQNNKLSIKTLPDLRWHCECGAPIILAQYEFLNAIIVRLSNRLLAITDKSLRKPKLDSEIQLINENLPNRVWLPLYSQQNYHYVLRINPTGVLLNSKDKAPFLIFVEVLEYKCPNNLQQTSPLNENGEIRDTIKHVQSLDNILSQNDNTHFDNDIANKSTSFQSLINDTSNYASQSSLTSFHSCRQFVVSPTKGSTETHLTIDALSITSSSLSSYLIDPEDPSIQAFSEPWLEKRSRIREESPFGHLPCWNLYPVIVKFGDDLRQELLAHQIMHTLQKIWAMEKIPLKLQPYDIFVFNSKAGMIKPFVNAISLHQIKKSCSLLNNIPDDELTIEIKDVCTNTKDSVEKKYEETHNITVSNTWRSSFNLYRKISSLYTNNNTDDKNNITTIKDKVYSPNDFNVEPNFEMKDFDDNIKPDSNSNSEHDINSDNRLGSESKNNGQFESRTNHKKLKRQLTVLLDYFLHEFGDVYSESFLNAQRNFVESCAAYCILCYLLLLKDRHNGNILLDNEGHIIHIDFAYMLSHTPRNLGFESSPFKLTHEFVEVMGGKGSDMYEYFKILILKGLLAARKHMDKLVTLIEILQLSPQMPCFKNSTTVKMFKERFHLNMTEEQLKSLVDSYVDSSLNSLSTRLYDGFQYLTNGIL